jgi:hypothetical protein
MSEKVVNFKPCPVKHTLESKPRDWKKPHCDHRQMLIVEKKNIVECKSCGEELTPMEALLIVAREIWWTENARERQVEHDEKRVTKVQTAAVEHLHAAGITPEKYAVRWAKEDEKRKVVELEQAAKQTSVKSITGGNGAA